MDEVLEREIVAAVRRFVDRDVIPNASALEHRDEYPHAMVATMRELGLFGATIPADFGGLGLSFLTYARVMEELSRGWMSLAGVINSHLIMAYVIANHGTDAQKKLFPARDGPRRQARRPPRSPSLTPAATSNRFAPPQSAAATTTSSPAPRCSSPMRVTARCSPSPPKQIPTPIRLRGISMFAVEKSDRGPTVSRNLDKLGYKGIDTCEVLFEDVSVPATSLIGGAEGTGFKQVMSALEVGRINVAARAVE